MFTRASDFAFTVRDGFPTVRVCGDVDTYNLNSFGAVLDIAEHGEEPAVVVVLDQAGYVCARAYAMLATMYQRLMLNHRRMYIVCSQRFCLRIMHLLNVPFPIYRSFEAIALAESGEAQEQQ